MGRWSLYALVCLSVFLPSFLFYLCLTPFLEEMVSLSSTGCLGTVLMRLALNSQRYSSFCLPSAEIKSVLYYTLSQDKGVQEGLNAWDSEWKLRSHTISRHSGHCVIQACWGNPCSMIFQDSKSFVCCFNHSFILIHDFISNIIMEDRGHSCMFTWLQ